MKKQIIFLTVLMVVFIPFSSLGGANNYQIDKTFSPSSTNQVSYTDDISITLSPAPLFNGLNMEIKNDGSETFTDLIWSLKAKPVVTGTGIIRKSIENTGVIAELDAGESALIQFRPFREPRSPIGFANTYINASIKIEDSLVRAQQQSMLFFIFLVGYKDTYIDITPATAYSMLLNNSFDLIIDVVGLDIYTLGHLPGAVNYVWADGTLNQQIPTLDKNQTYLVYCHTDPPSTASAQALVDAGIQKTYRLEGNYRAWVDAGYPIET